MGDALEMKLSDGTLTWIIKQGYGFDDQTNS